MGLADQVIDRLRESSVMSSGPGVPLSDAERIIREVVAAWEIEQASERSRRASIAADEADRNTLRAIVGQAEMDAQLHERDNAEIVALRAQVEQQRDMLRRAQEDRAADAIEIERLGVGMDRARADADRLRERLRPVEHGMDRYHDKWQAERADADALASELRIADILLVMRDKRIKSTAYQDSECCEKLRAALAAHDKRRQG